MPYSYTEMTIWHSDRQTYTHQNNLKIFLLFRMLINQIKQYIFYVLSKNIWLQNLYRITSVTNRGRQNKNKKVQRSQLCM